jgi:Pyruvate/2-oxoacid:ferredoxin oxidoreductase gamma subunit
LASIRLAIEERFEGVVAERNVAAASAAFAYVEREREGMLSAATD